MNTDIFYAASIVGSIAGFYLLWALGFQPLFVDEFRDALFEIRQRLYQMAADGQISPDHRAYRNIERLINGLIRFAHLFNLSFLLMSSRAYERADMQDDPELDISRAISEVKDINLREELVAMDRQIRWLVNRQMMRASLPMIFLSRVAAPLTRDDKGKRAVKTFEREVYNACPAPSHNSALIPAC